MKRKKIVLCGNPNVGKSTVFNALTGMKQHTGNWSGKTVGSAEGILKYGGKEISVVDLPGTYSLATDSAEEEVTRDYLCFEEFSGAVVVCDACSLERNLLFALQVARLVPNTLLCVNMLDDAEKKGISIDISALSLETGLPAVGISAATGEGLDELRKMIFELSEKELKMEFIPVRYPKALSLAVKKISLALEKEFSLSGEYPAICFLENEHGFISEFERRFGKIDKNEILSTALSEGFGILSEEGFSANVSDKFAACSVLRAEEICLSAVSFSKNRITKTDSKADSVLTGSIFGIPIMLLLFGFIFWLTVSGANYPSELLSAVFERVGFWLEDLFCSIGTPPVLKSLFIDGIWNVLSWVVAVMLPPMAIFFPLFTILEDIGYLPRVAFNLDRGFKASGACGKQALTMCMVYYSDFPHIFFQRCFQWNIPQRFISAFQKRTEKKIPEVSVPKTEFVKGFFCEKYILNNILQIIHKSRMPFRGHP